MHKLAILASAIFTLFVGATRIAAQCDWQPLETWTGLDNIVKQSVLWDPDGDGPLPEMLTVVGSFGVAGDQYAFGIAQWDGEHWRTLTPGSASWVNVARPQVVTVWNGQLVVGSTIGVWIWTGTEWARLGSGMSDTLALAVYNGSLIAVNNYRIPSRWTGSAWEPLSSQTGFTRAMTVHNGELIVAGDFVSINGVPANHIAAWNGTSWHALGAGLDSTVYSLFSDGGSLYVGGSFATAGGVPASGIARWDGTAWHPMGDGLYLATNPVVRVLTIQAFNGQIYAGGMIGSSGTTPIHGVGVWDGTAWQQVNGQDGAGTTNTMSVFQGALYIGGYPQTSTISYLARWDGTTLTACGAQTRSSCNGLAVFQGQLWAGGYKPASAGIGASYLSSNDGSGWTDRTTSEVPLLPSAIGVVGSSLVLASDFGATGAYDGTTYTPLFAGFGTYVWPSFVGSFNGQPIMAAHTGLFQWDGTNWGRVGNLITDSNGYPVGFSRTTTFHDELYATGNFPGGLLRLHGGAWGGISFLGGGSKVALSVYNDQLIVGGALSNGGPYAPAASYDGTTWTLMPTPTPINSATMAVQFAVDAGALYALIVDSHSFGLERSWVARWNGSSWEPIGSQLLGIASSMVLWNGSVVVGGQFIGSESGPAPYLARIAPPCPGDLDDGSGSGQRDCAVTIDDLLYFLGAFEAGGTSADLDNGSGTGTPDGGIDINDLFFFLTHFEAGC